MNGSRALVLAAALAAASVGLCFGQDVSEKKDLAVFALSTYDADVPRDVMGSIDAAIQEVFINIGRFNVLGMTYRLGRGDVEQFIAKIKEFKEKNIQIPEKVQMGKEFFTEADLNKILGAFIVVIPTVTSFDIEGSSTSKSSTSSTDTTNVFAAAVNKAAKTTTTKDTTGSYHANLKASFTFVDIEKMSAIAVASIETDGYDDSGDKAAQEAVDSIPEQLTYEIRKIEEFKLKTGVVEVQGRTVILELGRDMGV
jgi:hypothetical protein